MVKVNSLSDCLPLISFSLHARKEVALLFLDGCSCCSRMSWGGDLSQSSNVCSMASPVKHILIDTRNKRQLLRVCMHWGPLPECVFLRYVVCIGLCFAAEQIKIS